jgi:hypothetical protein
MFISFVLVLLEFVFKVSKTIYKTLDSLIIKQYEIKESLYEKRSILNDELRVSSGLPSIRIIYEDLNTPNDYLKQSHPDLYRSQIFK